MEHTTSRLPLAFPSWKGAIAPLMLVACGLTAGLLSGCQDDEIRHYQVRKPETTRLLGAILPQGKQVWFFKLMGPAPEVEKHAKEFDQFLESLRFTKDAKRPLTWTLPEGWEEDQEPSKQHYAAIDMSATDFLLTLKIDNFDAQGKMASVPENVNRWGKQLDLGEIGKADLDKCTRERKLEVGTATIVDLNSGMKLSPPRPPITYDTPEGWKKKAKLPPFALAAFDTGDGAEVSVSPLGKQAGGLVENVNRWRHDQLGMVRANEDQIRKDLQPVDVGGVAGNFVDLTGPDVDGRAPQRILGAIVEQGEQTWFFKMRGPAAVVGKQKAAFEAFLKSVRFDEGAGANNG